MRNLPLVILGITAILVIAGVFFLTSKSSTSKDPRAGLIPDAYTYFWSETCPHCKNVADFLATWKNPGINIDKKEVSQNRTNAELLTETAIKCNIPPDQVGVPLLVTPEGKCFNGDKPIIDYLKSLSPEATQSATPSATPTNKK